ncbi:SigmaK-factor processing regulatory protein BofA [Candidatus Methanoperedens nitroreducens]|uniref:SigmaK-factor processing regulatory protein BofA n=1 Tax=Candidatus Methanoperedens nitratireducens TaxID=1392998 RepID=A0A062V371_9EURY|nr:pro-sigmaK processing inhibitor BofA family protein [Candidatus Methanoperedens nitroreducens]KCZ71053.1 SigmaK-factor processing regulatory protein BofA [Candidatus Methanoperedens nitroreducens]MDJ1421572.1 pro-sigmaK processing inhibitor BofA family protein [Candidatus Methanoperedens sp.]
MTIEIIVLFLVILAVILVYYILKTAKHLIVNTVLGLVLLAISNFIFTDIAYTVPVLLIFALGGIPGAVLVILLHILGVAF